MPRVPAENRSLIGTEGIAIGILRRRPRLARHIDDDDDNDDDDDDDEDDGGGGGGGGDIGEDDD